MALPFKMIGMRNVPRDSDNCSPNSMEHSVECVEELSEGSTELSPQKLRSPPPKPPRRRHSDQLSVSPTGTFPSHRRKQDEGIQPCRKEIQLKISSNKLGCGSLPANWPADFYKYQTNEDTPTFRNCHSSSYVHLQNSHKKVPLLENLDFGHNKAGNGNKMQNTKVKSSESRNKSSDIKYSNSFMKFDSVLSKFYMENSDNLMSVDKKNEKLCSENEVTKKNESQALNLKSFQKEYHRRHHSDPILSCFDRSATRNSLPKSTLRSHSFLGCTSSEGSNKCHDSISTCSTCKETHCLYEEIKALKEINDKLWQHLCSVQACLENLKKKSSEETSTLSVSDLLSNLYYAQKAKDCAMERRLKAAVEDRDAVLLELEEMVQVLTRSFEDNDSVLEEKSSNKEIQELLQEIEVTHNPSKLFHYQRLLLAHIYNLKGSRQDQMSHELKLAVMERDNLREKVKKLEEEIKNMKICTGMWHLDNKRWENGLLDILCHVIHQRDLVLSKTENNQSLDHLGFRSSKLNKAHPTEQHANSDFESLQKHEHSSVNQKTFQSFKEGKECSQFGFDMPAEEMKLLKGEVIVLSRALEVEVEKREKAEERCLRLERLVNVLRKKLNGQNVGIPV